MDIAVESQGDIAVVSLRGEYLIMTNVEDFKRDIAPVMETQKRVVFDLSQLQFIDSSGLGAILSCLRKLTASGGDLKLCALTPPVRELVEVTRMHRIFDIFDTSEEAIQSFGART